jgi:DNA primase
VASRIARDEIAAEVAQKLQIDSTVLRQELRHVATARGTAKISAPNATALTEVERVLVRALAGGTGLGHEGVSSREGEDPEFDPQRQAHFALVSERLHEGLSAETLIAALLQAAEQGTDPMTLELSEADRRTMAAALMDENEPLTPESLHAAFEALRHRRLEHRQRELKSLIADAERKQDSAALGQLLREKMSIDKLVRPGDESANR